MYSPKSLRTTDAEALAFIDSYSFGVMVSNDLAATHLPFIRRASEHGGQRLVSHMARANGHWQDLDGQQVVVIFTGPHAYISPSWYDSRPGVPTWNYTAVHCYGTVRLLNDEQTIQAVEDAVSYFEPSLAQQPDIVTAEYRDRLLPAIVGLELDVERIEGKFKLGQNKPTADQAGVFKNLQDSQRPDDRQLASFMRKHGLGMGV